LFNVHASFSTSLSPSSNDVDDKGDDNLENKIIKLMDSNPRISVADIITSVSMSRTTVERVIRKLKANGEIKRVGNTKSGHWETLG
jgi:predicted HTH transcriptional regulator